MDARTQDSHHSSDTSLSSPHRPPPPFFWPPLSPEKHDSIGLVLWLSNTANSYYYFLKNSSESQLVPSRYTAQLS